MELYIDKENLRNFILERDNEQYQDCYDDCVRMLKRQIQVIYNFEKSRELLEDACLGSYFRLSSQGCGTSESLVSYSAHKFPERPVRANVATRFTEKQHSAIFLIDDERTDLFAANGNVLVGQVGEEVEVLKSLFCGNDYDFHKLYDLQSENSFSRWEQLSCDGLNLPLSDIIIMDRYLGTQNELSEYNVFKLIDVLLERVHSEVNVVLLCDKSYYDRGAKQTYTPDWDDFRSKIKSRLRRDTGKNGNVTIVFNPQSNRQHDRTIFTNYMMYRSGDSFCYFNSTGEKITNGNALDVDSLAKKSNYDFAMSFINSVQEICDNVRRLNNDLIIGDRRSFYIRF